LKNNGDILFDVPILLLIFNRPDTAEKVINNIRAVKPTKLFIAADGPRQYNENDLKKCEDARSVVLNAIDWDCEVKTLFRDHNLGCGVAVSQAITWFFEHVEEGVIFEDDILANQSFFKFCKAMLEKYRHEPRIMHINGANSIYPFMKLTEPYYFSKLPAAWGWATWKRAWATFKYDVNELDKRKVQAEIDTWANNKALADFMMKTFLNLKPSHKNVWDYQWMFSIFASDGLVITPSVNLTLNIGFGNNATNTNSHIVQHYHHMKMTELTSFDADVEMKPNLNADRFGMKKYLGITSNLFFRALRYAKRKLQSKT